MNLPRRNAGSKDSRDERHQNRKIRHGQYRTVRLRLCRASPVGNRREPHGPMILRLSPRRQSAKGKRPLSLASVSKHTSIGTRCNDGTKARRLAGLPPRLALPLRLALQRRRSTRRHSSRSDGNRLAGRGESQLHSHQRPELSDWAGPVRVTRGAWIGQRQR